jgi:hypothetical protein
MNARQPAPGAGCPIEREQRYPERRQVATALSAACPAPEDRAAMRRTMRHRKTVTLQSGAAFREERFLEQDRRRFVGDTEPQSSRIDDVEKVRAIDAVACHQQLQHGVIEQFADGRFGIVRTNLRIAARRLGSSFD